MSNSQAKTSNTSSIRNTPWTDKSTEAMHNTVDKVSDKASVAEDKIRKTASQSAEGLADRKERLEEQIKSSATKAKTLASENPLATAGIAFATGLLVSSLLRRKS